jgi:hypothetical protein
MMSVGWKSSQMLGICVFPDRHGKLDGLEIEKADGKLVLSEFRGSAYMIKKRPV